MSRHHIGRTLAFVAATGLAGCGAVLPERGAIPDLYQLGYEAGAVAEPDRTIAGQLVVEEPLASRGLDTDRIAVRPDAYELKYLAGVRWSDRAPRLVQAALVQRLERAGALAGVGRPSDGLISDYALISELAAFEVVTSSGGPHVRIALRAKLVRAPGGTVIAARPFTADVEAGGRSNKDVVAAFDAGVRTVAEEATAWIIEQALQNPPVRSRRKVGEEAPPPVDKPAPVALEIPAAGETPASAPVTP